MRNFNREDAIILQISNLNVEIIKNYKKNHQKILNTFKAEELQKITTWKSKCEEAIEKFSTQVSEEKIFKRKEKWEKQINENLKKFEKRIQQSQEHVTDKIRKTQGSVINLITQRGNSKKSEERIQRSQATDSIVALHKQIMIGIKRSHDNLHCEALENIDQASEKILNTLKEIITILKGKIDNITANSEEEREINITPSTNVFNPRAEVECNIGLG